MTDEEREQLQEAKIFAISVPVVLPLLKKRKQVSLELLLSEFRQGRTDNLARIAELNAFALLEMELEQKEREYQTLEERYVKTDRE